MQKTYKRAIFEYIDYEDMKEIFRKNYADKYRLIGYRLTMITEQKHRALMIMYPLQKEVKK
jgi:hypothetical protein